MTKDINFLRDRRKKLTQAQANDKKILKLSLICFVVVVVLATITTGVYFYYFQQQKNLVAQQEQLKSSILSQESIERKYILLAGKVQAAKQIFKLRQDKQAAINYLYSRLGANIILQQIEYESVGKVTPLLVIRVQADDIFVFRRVQELISSEEVKDKYPGIASSNIDREADGKYTIQLSIPLKSS